MTLNLTWMIVSRTMEAAEKAAFKEYLTFYNVIVHRLFYAI